MSHTMHRRSTCGLSEQSRSTASPAASESRGAGSTPSCRARRDSSSSASPGARSGSRRRSRRPAGSRGPSFAVDRVVEVARRFAVDGHQRQIAQVFAALAMVARAPRRAALSPRPAPCFENSCGSHACAARSRSPCRDRRSCRAPRRRGRSAARASASAVRSVRAQMAELVDALGSGPSGGNTVEVRVLFWAPK
jgi:hypothetical protein